MSYLRGFLPWITFSAVSTLGWQWGAAVALALSVVLMASGRRSGATIDAQILDLGTIAYFTALTAIAFTDPGSPLKQFDGGMSSAWLALVAWTSLAIGRPFTTGIARRRVPREIWSLPDFRHTNVVITLAWAIGFTCEAIIGLTCDATHASVLIEAANTMVGFGIPMWFTHRYAARVRARQNLTTRTSLATAH